MLQLAVLVDTALLELALFVRVHVFDQVLHALRLLAGQGARVVR